MLFGLYNFLLRRFSRLYFVYIYQTYLSDFSFVNLRSVVRFHLIKSHNGIRLPSPWLRWLVIHKVDPEIFIESGRIQVHDLILPLIERHGRPIESMDAILDFGCGCGRLLRHFPDKESLQLWGCDYNACLVKWCKKYLKNCRTFVNSSLPPVSLDSEMFDFIYARSVFTHFTEAYQNKWLEEIRRLLKPDGLFLITIKGQHAYKWLSPAEKEQYDRDEIVVKYANRVGENACSTFHPLAYIYGILKQHKFAVLERIPANTYKYMRQDTLLVRKDRFTC